MKKTDKIISGIIIVVIIAAGGYFAYNKLIGSNDANGIEDRAVETAHVGDVEFDYTVPMELSVLEIIRDTDASFFDVRNMMAEEKVAYSIYQTDKEGYDAVKDSAMGSFSEDKMVRSVSGILDSFLNSSYEDIGSRIPGEGYTSVLIEDKITEIYADLPEIESTFGPSPQAYIDQLFGGSIDDFFVEHKLVLSCEDIRFEKIGISIDDIENSGEKVFSYYLTGTAELTTESAEGNLSDAAFLPKAGENRNVDIAVAVNASGVMEPQVFFYAIDLQ